MAELRIRVRYGGSVGAVRNTLTTVANMTNVIMCGPASLRHRLVWVVTVATVVKRRGDVCVFGSCWVLGALLWRVLARLLGG